MKNITLSVDDELYERSRVIAAERKTTVTGLVREHLEGLTRLQENRTRARKEIREMIGGFGGKVGSMPAREERHARG